MPLKNKIFLLLLLSLSGCGFFSKKVESIVEKEERTNAPAIKPIKKNLFCRGSNKLQLILEDESAVKFYGPLFSVFENKMYSFVQKSALLSLVEMMRRPDVASPTSRLQFFLRLKGKDYYYDISSKNSDESLPYLKAVELLMKNFDNPKTLHSLTEALDTVVPLSINVSPELETFLQHYRNDITKNEVLTDYFIKGDEVLTKHESFKRHSFKKTYIQYLSNKMNSDSYYKIDDSQLKFVETEAPDLEVTCNLDINKEVTSKEDLLQTKVTKNSHYFAMMEGQNLFIAVNSSTLPEKITNLKDTYFIKTTPPSMPLPVCKYKNKVEDIILFSTRGRFPNQHLRHLVTYDIGLADSQDSLNDLLTFSRHLFLSTPDRILYESKRGRKAQLDFFLTMNFPIYHVSALGDIIGAAVFSSPKENSKSLIIDDRSSARLRCSPQ